MRKHLIGSLAVAVLLFGTTAAGLGAVIHVPAGHATIQGGIDAAVDGDTVLVAPGTYVENIDFKGKLITVKSSDGPATTIIDGNKAGSVVVFVSNERNESVLEGFTITNGTGTLDPVGGIAMVGGGIFTLFSSPTIRNNIVEKNAVTGPFSTLGGGIGCLDPSTPRIIGNVIRLNTLTGRKSGGGGVAVYFGTDAEITGNVIHGNTSDGVEFNHGGGGISCGSCDPVISQNVIYSNSSRFGGGILTDAFSTPIVRSNLIFNNQASDGGGGIAVGFDTDSALIEHNTLWGNTATNEAGGILVNAPLWITISDSILWNNSAPSGAEMSVWAGASVTVGYSDVQGGPSAVWVKPGGSLTWGTGNIDLDPLFVNPTGGDFTIPSTSPVLDVGDPAAACCGEDLASYPRTLDGDLDGDPRTDMGAYEFGNVHLGITGSATPGGTLMVGITGQAGLTAHLFVGVAPGEACLWPHGCLLFDTGSPFLGFVVGTIPVSFSATLPTVLPSLPLSLVVQSVGVGTSAGNASNAVDLTIE